LKRVCIVVKEGLEEANGLANEIGGYLNSKDIENCIHSIAPEKASEDEKTFCDFEADLVLVLAGDGTVLWTASRLPPRKTPILGINFGGTGFLTEIKPEDWKPALERIMKGDYYVEERGRLDVIVNGKVIGSALNEAVLMTSVAVKMLPMEIGVDDELVESIRSDGVIISTPTGSTAYSMSAGGPIVGPGADVFIITSICPFKLDARSIVVPGGSTIKIKLTDPVKKATLVVDGKETAELVHEDEIVLKVSVHKSHFVKLEKDFYKRVRERLGS